LKEISTMTAPDGVPLHALAEDDLAAASPDLLRATVKMFAETDAVCGAEYGQTSDGRDNHRNRLPPARAGHQGRDRRAGHLQAAAGQLL
jgi:putative transposase